VRVLNERIERVLCRVLCERSTPKAAIDPETGEPEEVEPPNEYETENVLSDATMLAAVGVGFTQTEWYNVMLSIKKLGEDPVKLLKTVRCARPRRQGREREGRQQ